MSKEVDIQLRIIDDNYAEASLAIDVNDSELQQLRSFVNKGLNYGLGTVGEVDSNTENQEVTNNEIKP